MKILLVRILRKIATVVRNAVDVTTLCILPPDRLSRFSAGLYSGHAAVWQGPAMNRSGFLSEGERLMYERRVFPIARGRSKSAPPQALDLFCGGGREALVLLDHGFHVTGVEGIPAILESARQNTQSFGDRAHFERGVVPFDKNIAAFPDDADAPLYDVVIISPGMYSCIPGRRHREDLLRKCKRMLRESGVIVLSAYIGPGIGRRFMAWKKALACLSFGNTAVQSGDHFRVEFIHYFRNRAEVEAEFAAAGLHIVDVEEGALAPAVEQVHFALTGAAS